MPQTRKRKAKNKMLTETELELMNILWRLGEGSVHDVMEALPENRELAYTSVSTMLRILEQKEMVEARKVGRGHIYCPRMARAAYQAKSVGRLVDKVFDGAPVSLVQRLLDTRNLSEDDLKALQEMLQERLT